MANYFDDILTGVELWFLYQHISDHGPADGWNNMILREKITTETQKVTLAQYSAWFSLAHFHLIRI
jgi:hypothetical protein